MKIGPRIPSASSLLEASLEGLGKVETMLCNNSETVKLAAVEVSQRQRGALSP